MRHPYRDPPPTSAETGPAPDLSGAEVVTVLCMSVIVEVVGLAVFDTAAVGISLGDSVIVGWIVAAAFRGRR